MNFLLTALEKRTLTQKLALGLSGLMLALVIGLYSLHNQGRLSEQAHLIFENELLAWPASRMCRSITRRW